MGRAARRGPYARRVAHDPRRAGDDEPVHPTGRAILLMVAVVVLIVVLAAAPLLT